MKVVFVVGTGTDVGKTHITAALASLARERLRVGAYKPVASGGGEDADRLAAALSGRVVPTTYALREPLSPHLAARKEGVTIDVAALARVIEDARTEYDVLFVETAGGLYSPLGETTTNADLVRAVDGAIVLVAVDRLGVLHDVGATSRAAAGDGLAMNVVALSAPERADTSTGTNASELRTLGLARQVVVFPRARPSDEASRRAARDCLAELAI